jgi:translation initiation factor IF-3
LNTVKDKNLPINEFIKATQMQVISADGQNYGILTKEQALKMAKDNGLDLVLVSDTGQEGVPVAKIVDYGKVLYAKKKKQSEAKKHQKIIQLKEVKLRPKIGEHDYETKIKQAAQFLIDGKHVKFTLVFRGREVMQLKDRGAEMFDKILVSLQNHGVANIIVDKEAKAGSQWSKIFIAKK